MMPELRGITTIYATGNSIWNNLGSELQLIHLNGGNYWCCIYLLVFDSHARDTYGNSHSEGTLHVYCWKYHPLHKLVQYFQSLSRNEDIYELKGVNIANFEADLFSSSVE